VTDPPRAGADEVATLAEFGVAGFLYRNNLVMYDRRNEQSLWPQMSRGARCGSAIGTELTQLPAVDMTWRGWKSLHPDSRIVSRNTGYSRNYRFNPYAEGGSDDGSDLLPGGDGSGLPFPMPEPIDDRRPMRERVVGIPDGEGGGVAYPFGLLNENADLRVVADTVGGDPLVVLWSRKHGTGTAFHTGGPDAPGRFEVVDGAFTDRATGSVWTIEGKAVEGPRAGDVLDPVARSYVAYWFAWAAFQSETEIWRPAEG
jgi:hypothetical protein